MESESPKLKQPKTGTEILRPLFPRRRYSTLVFSSDSFKEGGRLLLIFIVLVFLFYF